MNGRNVPPELRCLTSFIDSNTECLSGSSSELRSIALCAAKYIFDWALESEKSSKPHLGALLATLTEVSPPQTRSRARNAPTRKHSSSPIPKSHKQVDIGETPLPFLFIDGMNTDQIWQQLDLRAARICENLRVLQGESEDENVEGENSDDESEGDDDENEDEDESEEMVMDVDGDLWEESSGEDSEDDGSATEDVTDLQEELSEDEEDDEVPTSMLHIIRGQQKPDPSEPCFQVLSNLDDGFFDLAQFNAETSGEKEVSQRKLNVLEDEDSTEESDVDLFDSIYDSELKGVDDGIVPFYRDFFEPPRRNQNKRGRSSKVRFHERVSVKKIKAVGKGMPVSSMYDEDSDEEAGDDTDDDSESST